MYEFTNWTEYHKVQLGWNSHTTNSDRPGQCSRKGQPEIFIFTDKKGRKIGESEITGVEGDQNVTPQFFTEDDDLDEQDVVDKELAAQPIEYEDHLEEDLNQ